MKKKLGFLAALGVGAALTLVALRPNAETHMRMTLDGASLLAEGATIELGHALALRYDNEEGFEEGPRLRLFLTDREMPLELAGAANRLRARAYARRADVRGVIISGDPTPGGKGADIHLLDGAGAEPGVFITLSSTHALKQLEVSSDRVSGTISVNEQGVVLQGSFDLPLKAYPVTEIHAGQAAAQSPQTRAMVAYLAALRRADLDGAARSATRTRIEQLRAMRERLGEDAFREAMAESPEPSDFPTSVERVVVRAASATLIASDSFIDFVLEDGVWKLD